MALQDDAHFVDGVRVRHVNGTPVNVATEEKAEAIRAAVAAVEAAVTALHLDVEINADQVNLNTDDLETLTTATNAAIAALQAANDASGDDIVTAVAAAQSALTTALSTLQASNETHSDEEQAAIASLEAAVAAFRAAFDARDLATSAKQDAQTTELQAIRDRIGATTTPAAGTSNKHLADLVAKDFATQTTLATLLTEARFDAEDFATQATLEAARVLLAAIEADTSNLDVALSTRASEATVATLLTEATFAAEDFASQTTLEAARVLLTSLDAKDFATSAKQDAQTAELQDIEADVEATNVRLGEVSATPTANTVLARLKDVHDKLSELDTAFDGEDFATAANQATVIARLDSLLTELQQKLEAGQSIDVGNFPADYPDTAAQSSLAQIDADLGAAADAEATGNGSLIAITKRLRTLLSSLDGKDFATQATLASALAELQAINADLDVVLSTRASESTLSSFRTETGTNLNDIEADIEAGNALLATIRDHLDTVETKLQSLIDADAYDNVNDRRKVAVETSALPAGAATEATVATLLTEATFSAEDFASETTLAAFKAEQKTEADETQAAIAAHQASNEADFAAANTSLDAIESDADAIRIATQSVDTKTPADPATVTKQTEAIASLGTDGGTAPDAGTGIRGWLRSILDWFKARIDGNGYIAVSTHDSAGIDIAAGRIFTSGGQVSLGSSQQGSIHFENPVATPTKKMTVLGFSAYVDTTTSLRVEFLEDATQSGGSARNAVNHNFASAATAVALVHTGQGILSGGTLMHPSGRVTRDDHFSYQGAPFAGITPGKSLAMRVTAPSGLGTNVLVDYTVVWKEEDI